MQGIYIHGRRPKSKKEVKEFAASNPNNVRLEATSIFGNEFDGYLSSIPDGTYTFVGPDPSRDRRFYGTITVRAGKVSVK